MVIENVTPRVDGGRFPAKRIVGDALRVEADAFTDGHDEIRVVMRWCGPGETEWHEQEMQPLGNDRWRATTPLESEGRYEFTVSACIDRWRTWRHDLEKRIEAGQDVAVDLQIGGEIVEQAAASANASSDVADSADAEMLRGSATSMTAEQALDENFSALVDRYPDRSLETTLDKPYAVVVDRERARFSSWYELFPRSASPIPNRHGSFRDVINRLPYVQELGFDVLYLPPIHPIGQQFRKGPNNKPSTDATDPGVPWAIGSAEGGHDAVHPQLGTLDDFRALLEAAKERGIEIALDIAFQASPDHPWVKEHPQWFRARPDGTIQYAENPPKKYQDIYPFDFESRDWRGLWEALAGVVRFWIRQGVRIFRIDNPHTKPFAFWEWLITSIKADHPDALFLAEAFTRPKVMYRLGKLGFTQSYTYFTWRNQKAEIGDYFTELNSAPVSEFFRPNAWPNTPDILHEVLQTGGRAAFEARLVLAGTLCSSYGIYGPPYELLQGTPRDSGTEEYLDSEKYQQRTWDLDRRDSIRGLIARVNRARRDHPALQSNDRLWFHDVDNDALIAYTKNSDDRADVILTIVNLDYARPQSGTLELDLAGLGLPTDGPIEAIDLLDDATYRWQGSRTRVDLDPERRAAHVLWLR